MNSENETEYRTIVLIEDNLDHAELVKRAVEDQYPGLLLHHLRDGAEALDFLHAEHAGGAPARRPALVLLDLRLPKVDGLDVLRAVKQAPELRVIPVVVLTTSTSQNDMNEAYRCHANSYLQKPWDFGELNSMMKDVVGYWLHRNRSPET
jgi:CheY-like chemotaxis protein